MNPLLDGHRDDEVMTPSEMARAIGVARRTLYEWCSRGTRDVNGQVRTLKRVKFGGRFVVRVQDFRAFIAMLSTGESPIEPARPRRRSASRLPLRTTDVGGHEPLAEIGPRARAT